MKRAKKLFIVLCIFSLAAPGAMAEEVLFLDDRGLWVSTLEKVTKKGPTFFRVESVEDMVHMVHFDYCEHRDAKLNCKEIGSLTRVEISKIDNDPRPRSSGTGLQRIGMYAVSIGIGLSGGLASGGLLGKLLGLSLTIPVGGALMAMIPEKKEVYQKYSGKGGFTNLLDDADGEVIFIETSRRRAKKFKRQLRKIEKHFDKINK